MSKLLKAVAAVGSTGVLASVYLLHSNSESNWKNISMPIIRMLDAEQAHKLAVKTASWGLVPKFETSSEDKKILKTSVLGLSFNSPVGLAAGFDKHAECMDGMLKMGFSFVEVGSITPKSQEGNPKPRVFRLLEDNAVINRYGFNSCGLDYAYNNLLKRQSNTNKQAGVVAVNLGKNKTSENAVNDYIEGVMKLGEFADYLVINISSPNTPGLRRMQGKQQLRELIKKVLEARNNLKNKPPLLVKIAPDLTETDKKDIAEVIMNEQTKIDGLVVSNTTISRPSHLKSVNKNEVGGLSGVPVKDLSTQCIKDMFVLTQGTIPIIGVGGISNGKDAYDKICGGASLVQLYSSMSIHGPPVIGQVKRELAELLRADGFKSVSDAVGADVIPFHCPTDADVSQ